MQSKFNAWKTTKYDLLVSFSVKINQLVYINTLKWYIINKNTIFFLHFFVLHWFYIQILFIGQIGNMLSDAIPLTLCKTNPYNKAVEKFEWNFNQVILKQTFVIDSCSISCEIDLKWMSRDLTDDKSILVQVMAWCCQAINWVKVDQNLYHHMASLGHNELINVLQNRHGTAHFSQL